MDEIGESRIGSITENTGIFIPFFGTRSPETNFFKVNDTCVTGHLVRNLLNFKLFLCCVFVNGDCYFLSCPILIQFSLICSNKV